MLVFDSETEIIENWEFITDENQILKSIHIVTYANAIYPYNSKIDLVVYTAIMSQSNANIFTAEEAVNQLSQTFFVSDFEEKH